MSANLWSDSTANKTIRADGTYLSGANNVVAELSCKVTGLTPLTENQTIHMGASLRGAGAGVLKPFVEYKDAAGNLNWVGFPSWQPTETWQRFEGTCVVPSGMTITHVGFNNSAATGDIEVSNPVFSYGTSGPILASDSHTPYATQDHVAAEYATRAQLKVDEDKITSEVGERTKLGGRVGTLESTSSEHTSKLTQLSSSIESMVKGEATYTAPDGTTKTNGLYSKITQTADGINETFGEYTKTADLASTAAVKDAKKAGTDAASAASAAQSTADAAKANAATAQTTANTAVTNASTAQSTADAAKTAAATAQSTADAANTTASNLATLIHRGDDGVTVGYSADGTTFTGGRTRQGTNSFDVLDASGNTTASFGKTIKLGRKTDSSGTERGILDIATYEQKSGSTTYSESQVNAYDMLEFLVYKKTTTEELQESILMGAQNPYIELYTAGGSPVTNGASLRLDNYGVSIGAGQYMRGIWHGSTVITLAGTYTTLFTKDTFKDKTGVTPTQTNSSVLVSNGDWGSYKGSLTAGFQTSDKSWNLYADKGMSGHMIRINYTIFVWA